MSQIRAGKRNRSPSDTTVGGALKRMALATNEGITAMRVYCEVSEEMGRSNQSKHSKQEVINQWICARLDRLERAQCLPAFPMPPPALPDAGHSVDVGTIGNSTPPRTLNTGSRPMLFSPSNPSSDGHRSPAGREMNDRSDSNDDVGNASSDDSTFDSDERKVEIVEGGQEETVEGSPAVRYDWSHDNRSRYLSSLIFFPASFQSGWPPKSKPEGIRLAREMFNTGHSNPCYDEEEFVRVFGLLKSQATDFRGKGKLPTNLWEMHLLSFLEGLEAKEGEAKSPEKKKQSGRKAVVNTKKEDGEEKNSRGRIRNK